MRQKIRERVNIPRGEPGSLIDSLKDSFFTGYIKIESRERSQALIFDDGNPVGVLRISENSIDITGPMGYGVPSEGKVEVYETDPIVVTTILRGAPDPERDRHFIIAGIGDPLQQSLPARALNLQKITELARENGVNGYILFHRNGKISGIILLSEGKPVLLFDGKNYGDEALETIRKGLDESYVSIMLLEPSVIPMITSLGKPQVQRSGRVKSISDLTSLLDDTSSRKLSALLTLDRGKVEKTLIFIFQGVPVATYQWRPLSFEEKDLDSLNFPLSFNLYPLYVNPSPREVPLKLEERDKREINLSLRDLERIREIFIVQVGSAGNALWNKVVSEIDLPDEDISIIEADRLIKKLALEIPKGEERNTFLQRARSLIS